MTDKTRPDQTERNNLRASVIHITTGGKEEEQQEDVPALLLFPVAGRRAGGAPSRALFQNPTVVTDSPSRRVG